MDMHDCNSSQIRRYGYDQTTRKMRVEFFNSGLYEYDDVPMETFEAFLSAPSKGSFHYRQIKGKFPYTRI